MNIIHKIIVFNKNTIILKNSHYFCRYRFKNQLRTFQPENSRQSKNKTRLTQKSWFLQKNVSIQTGKLSLITAIVNPILPTDCENLREEFRSYDSSAICSYFKLS